MKCKDNIDEIIQSIKIKLEKKNQSVFECEKKKRDISMKKTGVTDTYEV